MEGTGMTYEIELWRLLELECIFLALRRRECDAKHRPTPHQNFRGWFRYGLWRVGLNTKLLMMKFTVNSLSITEPLYRRHRGSGNWTEEELIRTFDNFWVAYHASYGVAVVKPSKSTYLAWHCRWCTWAWCHSQRRYICSQLRRWSCPKWPRIGSRKVPPWLPTPDLEGQVVVKGKLQTSTLQASLLSSVISAIIYFDNVISFTMHTIHKQLVDYCFTPAPIVQYTRIQMCWLQNHALWEKIPMKVLSESLALSVLWSLVYGFAAHKSSYAKLSQTQNRHTENLE